MTFVEHWLRYFLIWRERNDPGGFGSRSIPGLHRQSPIFALIVGSLILRSKQHKKTTVPALGCTECLTPCLDHKQK